MPILTENIPSEAYTIPHDERSMCCKPEMSDTLTHYVHYVAYSMGHDERSSQFEENKTDPLTACDYKQPPVVAQMSTTGGQMCWSASKADHMTKFSKNIAGALIATDWKDAPVLVTENKQLEVCAPMTDEDSTDRM